MSMPTLYIPVELEYVSEKLSTYSPAVAAKFVAVLGFDWMMGTSEKVITCIVVENSVTCVTVLVVKSVTVKTVSPGCSAVNTAVVVPAASVVTDAVVKQS